MVCVIDFDLGNVVLFDEMQDVVELFLSLMMRCDLFFSWMGIFVQGLVFDFMLLVLVWNCLYFLFVYQCMVIWDYQFSELFECCCFWLDELILVLQLENFGLMNCNVILCLVCLGVQCLVDKGIEFVVCCCSDNIFYGLFYQVFNGFFLYGCNVGKIVVLLGVFWQYMLFYFLEKVMIVRIEDMLVFWFLFEDLCLVDWVVDELFDWLELLLEWYYQELFQYIFEFVFW